MSKLDLVCDSIAPKEVSFFVEPVIFNSFDRVSHTLRENSHMYASNITVVSYLSSRSHKIKFYSLFVTHQTHHTVPCFRFCSHSIAIESGGVETPCAAHDEIAMMFGISMS
jgi:hypothetical protein